MPLSFDRFQGEGVFALSSSFFSDSHKISPNQHKIEDSCYVVVGEPTSVLDALRSPSPLSATTTTTTLSSSHGGGPVTATVTTGDDNKCSQMGLDDLEGVLSASSPSQEHSILRLIMDPGVFDSGFGFGSGYGPVSEISNPSFHFQQQISNPEALMDPPAKRFNSGSTTQPVFPFSDPDPVTDPFLIRRQHQFPFPFQQQISPPVPIPVQGMAGDDQSVIIEQLFNAAELITTTTGNDQTILAQGILARLNHHLNNYNSKPPFQRVSSYIIEALLSLIHDVVSPTTPENLILRIAAYRSFSETSPFLQFVNFTANQSILEACDGFDKIHIIDFDVGYGGQWSSLMQELVIGRRKSLKITVFAPPPSSVSEEFELRFTEENLKSFAEEIKIPFEIELLSLELLLNPTYWPISLRSSEKEAIAVNLPLNSVDSSYLPLILRFLKQISPNVVVCSDRSCDLNAPFPNVVIHALQYHTTLLESLQSQDDSMSIERFWIQPSIEKLLLMKRTRSLSSPPWRGLFSQSGFSPVSLSQIAEAQAECLIQRNPVRGFHVEKRLSSSLVLCWQRKELVTVSVWKC